MILCCKTCENCFESDFEGKSCDYCSGNTEVLFSDEEEKAIDKYELKYMIDISREKYKMGNAEYNADLWKSREYKEEINDKVNVSSKIMSHMLTTGYDFAGHTIVAYKGVISGQVVLGTGFLSEFTASFSDFFGTQSNRFSDKLEKAKEASIQKMIEKSVEKGGNAVIGVDFDYITFSNNMVGVVANGTSVIIEEKEEK